MLDALVDRQNRQIAGAGEAPMVEKRLETPQHAGGAVAGRKDPGDEVRAGKMQLRLRDRFTLVFEQVPGVVSQNRLELAERRRGGGGHLLLLLTGSVLKFRPGLSRQLSPDRGVVNGRVVRVL